MRQGAEVETGTADFNILETPEFKASAKVLKELVDHHIKEEERAIWAQVRDNFSTEARAQMNRDFLTAKKRVKLA